MAMSRFHKGDISHMQNAALFYDIIKDEVLRRGEHLSCFMEYIYNYSVAYLGHG